MHNIGFADFYLEKFDTITSATQPKVFQTIAPNNKIGQTFVTGNNVNYISSIVINAKISKSNTGNISFDVSLFDSPDKNVCKARWKGKIPELMDNETVITIPICAALKPNTNYYIELSTEAQTTSLISIGIQPESSEYLEGAAYLNGQEQRYDLWLKTISAYRKDTYPFPFYVKHFNPLSMTYKNSNDYKIIEKKVTNLFDKCNSNIQETACYDTTRIDSMLMKYYRQEIYNEVDIQNLLTSLATAFLNTSNPKYFIAAKDIVFSLVGSPRRNIAMAGYPILLSDSDTEIVKNTDWWHLFMSACSIKKVFPDYLAALLCLAHKQAQILYRNASLDFFTAESLYNSALLLNNNDFWSIFPEYKGWHEEISNIFNPCLINGRPNLNKFANLDVVNGNLCQYINIQISPYKDVQQYRRIFSIKNEYFFVVDDLSQLKNKKIHDAKQQWTFPSLESEFNQSENSLNIPIKNSKYTKFIAVPAWKDIAKISVEKNINRNETVLKVSETEKDKMSFASIFYPADENKTPETVCWLNPEAFNTPERIFVSLVMPNLDFADLIVFQPMDEQHRKISQLAWSSDAKCFWARTYKGNEVISLAMFDGSYLEVQGELLVQSETPVKYLEAFVDNNILYIETDSSNKVEISDLKTREALFNGKKYNPSNNKIIINSK